MEAFLRAQSPSVPETFSSGFHVHVLLYASNNPAQSLRLPQLSAGGTADVFLPEFPPSFFPHHPDEYRTRHKQTDTVPLILLYLSGSRSTHMHSQYTQFHVPASMQANSLCPVQKPHHHNVHVSQKSQVFPSVFTLLDHKFIAHTDDSSVKYFWKIAHP